MSDYLFPLAVLVLAMVTHTITYRLGRAAGRLDECRHRVNRIDSSYLNWLSAYAVLAFLVSANFGGMALMTLLCCTCLGLAKAFSAVQQHLTDSL